MTHEEIADTLYDELQHNKLTNSLGYIERMYELLDQAHPDAERVGDYVSQVEDIAHNRHSFGFCDMCEDYINYDEDGWYDLCGDLQDYERERIEERLPQIQKTKDRLIQDVCPACFNKLTKGE